MKTLNKYEKSAIIAIPSDYLKTCSMIEDFLASLGFNSIHSSFVTPQKSGFVGFPFAGLAFHNKVKSLIHLTLIPVFILE